MPQADPQRFVTQFTSWEVSRKANRWQGRNITRWRSAANDETFRDSGAELDPMRRAALFIRMNDLVVGSKHIIPQLNQRAVNGQLNNLRPVLSGWENTLWLLRDWHRVP